jgi:LPS sulfotransferase NodH
LEKVLTHIDLDYTGIKTLDIELTPDLNKYIFSHPRHRIIFLHRTNLLQLAVSRAIVNQTKVFHKHIEQKLIDQAYQGLQPIEPLDILIEIAGISRKLKVYQGCRSLPNVFEVTYEELYCSDNGPQKLIEIFDFLGKPSEVTKGMKDWLFNYKLNASYDCIPNLDEIKRLGNDQIGYL